MQILGGAKNFCPNFPKLARKKLQRKWPPKKRLHFFSCWVYLFKSKHNSSTTVGLAQISPNLPEKNKTKTWPIKGKKHLHLDFGCHFCKIKAHTAILRTVSQILPKFPQVFAGFSPNQKFWGFGCTHISYTSNPHGTPLHVLRNPTVPRKPCWKALTYILRCPG